MLGPLSFKQYHQEAPDFHLYADDTLLYLSIKSQQIYLNQIAKFVHVLKTIRHGKAVIYIMQYIIAWQRDGTRSLLSAAVY